MPNKSISYAPYGAEQPTLRSSCRLWQRYVKKGNYQQ